MLNKKDRTSTLLDAAIKEMELIVAMTERIEKPADFGSSLDGLVVFRACGMSLQYVTESFVKIRNLGLADLFEHILKYPGNMYSE